jgi:hypothetical protein
MTRGLGEQQKEARRLTSGKICTLVAIQPSTYQVLWKKSRVQKYTLRHRLDELVKQHLIHHIKETLICNPRSKYYIDNNITLKPMMSTNQHPSDLNYAISSSRKRYLLNYNNTEAKELVENYLFDYYYNYMSTSETVKEWLQGDNMFTKPKPPEIKADEEMERAIRNLLDIIKSIDIYVIPIEEYSKRSQLMRQLYDKIFQNKANHHVE